MGSEDYIRNVLQNALGAERAAPMLNRILNGESPRGLDALKWMDAPSVAQLIRDEHPQIIAIVLAHLEPDLAADVLVLLPSRLRPELVTRVATMDTVPPSALSELDALLDRRFSDNPNVQSTPVGGLDRAASLLNFLDASLETEVLDEIKNIDPDLGGRLDEALFTFDNLMSVDDRGLQTLLREISTDTLVVALKGADEPLREKFFRNMSKRAAELLRDDLEAKGPVRLAEVEQAQKEIIASARKLAEGGQITLGKGDDFV